MSGVLATFVLILCPAEDPVKVTVVVVLGLLIGVGLPVRGLASKPRSQQVACLNNLRQIGRGYAIWANGAKVGPGLYFARLTTPAGRFTRTLVLKP